MDYEEEFEEMQKYVIPSDYNPIIDCTGLKIEDVFVALYINASPIGLGNMQVNNEPFNHDHIKQLLSQSKWFDYLYGRPMKMCFENYPIIDCTIYDEYNVPGFIPINKLKQLNVNVPRVMPFYHSHINQTNNNQTNNNQTNNNEMSWNQINHNPVNYSKINLDPIVECERMMMGLHL